MQLQPVTLALQSEYESLAAHIDMTFYRFANVLMFAPSARYHYARTQGGLLVASMIPGREPYCLFPLGVRDLAAAICEACETLGSMVIEPIDAQMKAQLEAECPGLFAFEDQPALCDYVYATQNLIALEGKAYHAKRNFINRFTAEYDYEYIRLTDENARTLCEPVARRWFEAHPDMIEPDFDERSAIAILLENFDALRLRGGALAVNGNVVGFTLGERMNATTAHIIIEKADVDYTGAYAVLNRDFLAHEWADTQFVNREEDMGLTGLRRAKQSYHPLPQKMVYSARCIKHCK